MLASIAEREYLRAIFCAKIVIIAEFSLSLQSYLEKFIKLTAYSEKRSEKRTNFHEKVVTLHRDSEKSHP